LKITGEKLDDEEKRITGIIRASTKQMGTLIDDLWPFLAWGARK